MIRTESNTRKIVEMSMWSISSGRLNLGNTLLSIERSILNLIEQGSRKVVVNVTGLTAIDSAGIGMLISVSSQMEHHQGKMRIAGAQGGVARSFEIVHIDRVAAMDPDLDTACKALA